MSTLTNASEFFAAAAEAMQKQESQPKPKAEDVAAMRARLEVFFAGLKAKTENDPSFHLAQFGEGPVLKEALVHLGFFHSLVESVYRLAAVISPRGAVASAIVTGFALGQLFGDTEKFAKKFAAAANTKDSPAQPSAPLAAAAPAKVGPIEVGPGTYKFPGGGVLVSVDEDGLTITMNE